MDVEDEDEEVPHDLDECLCFFSPAEGAEDLGKSRQGVNFENLEDLKFRGVVH